MEIRDIKVGVAVVAVRDLRYAYNETVQGLVGVTMCTVLTGTTGVIVSVEGIQADLWSHVAVKFVGHDKIYNCDIPAATFSFARRI